MAAAAGVGADERLTPPAESFRQLGQSQFRGLDVVGGGVGARVAGPQQPHNRLAGPAAAVVDKPHQRVVSKGLLPGRGGVLLLRVRQDEDAVDVHDHLPVRVRRRLPGQPPENEAPRQDEALSTGGKSGSKHHLITDASALPLAATLTGGNRNDVTQVIQVLEAVPPVRGKHGRPRRRQDILLSDRDCDHDQ